MLDIDSLKPLQLIHGILIILVYRILNISQIEVSTIPSSSFLNSEKMTEIWKFRKEG